MFFESTAPRLDSSFGFLSLLYQFYFGYSNAIKDPFLMVGIQPIYGDNQGMVTLVKWISETGLFHHGSLQSLALWPSSRGATDGAGESLESPSFTGPWGFAAGDGQ